MAQRSAHQLVEFLTAVSAHERAEGATAAAAELAAAQLDAEVGAAIIGDALAAATRFGAVGLVHAHDDEVDLPGLGRCWVARAEWDADRRARLVVARRGTPFSADERTSLTGMARILELALRGVAAVGAEQMLRERHRLLEVLLDIQRSISHRKPLSEVLSAITSGVSGLLGGCPVALVLDDPLDPERPIVAATTAGGERSETELAIVRASRPWSSSSGCACSIASWARATTSPSRSTAPS